MSAALFGFSNAAWNALGIIINGIVLIVLAYLKTRVEKVADDVKEVRHATNSMKDELVAEVRKAEFAAGKKSETDKVASSDKGRSNPP